MNSKVQLDSPTGKSIFIFFLNLLSFAKMWIVKVQSAKSGGESGLPCTAVVYHLSLMSEEPNRVKPDIRDQNCYSVPIRPTSIGFPIIEL